MSQAVLSPPAQLDDQVISAANHAAIVQPVSAFTDAERQSFRDADLGVAKMIVGIMGTIFTIGLVMYTVIAFLAARGAD